MNKIIFFVFLLQFNLCFGFDYYAFVGADKKYLDKDIQQEITELSKEYKVSFLNVGDLPHDSMSKLLSEEFECIAMDGTVNKMKPYRVIYVNWIDIINPENYTAGKENYKKRRYPLLVFKSEKRTKKPNGYVIAFMDGIGIKSFEPANFESFSYDEFNKAKPSLLKVEINAPSKFTELIWTKHTFSLDKKWLNITKVEKVRVLDRLDRYNAVLYNGKIIKKFSGVNIESLISGIVTIGKDNYIINYEKVDFHEERFPVLHKFVDGKVVKRVVPLNKPSVISRELMEYYIDEVKYR